MAEFDSLDVPFLRSLAFILKSLQKVRTKIDTTETRQKILEMFKNDRSNIDRLEPSAVNADILYVLLEATLRDCQETALRCSERLFQPEFMKYLNLTQSGLAIHYTLWLDKAVRPDLKNLTKHFFHLFEGCQQEDMDQRLLAITFVDFCKYHHYMVDYDQKQHYFELFDSFIQRHFPIEQNQNPKSIARIIKAYSFWANEIPDETLIRALTSFLTLLQNNEK